MSKGKITISGYAAVYGVRYKMTSYVEVLAPGCFDKTDFSECCFLRDHNASLLLGRWDTPSLTIRPDSKGLWFKSELPNTAYALEAATLIRDKILIQCSFGFSGTNDNWFFEGNQQIREILKIDKVYDVSAVTWPASPTTSIKIDSWTVTPTPQTVAAAPTVKPMPAPTATVKPMPAPTAMARMRFDDELAHQQLCAIY